MRLKVGDILYIKKEGTELSDRPFTVTKLRSATFHHRDDVCVEWLDGAEWWWGQIGEDEPWSLVFITEVEYFRNKKLIELDI